MADSLNGRVIFMSGGSRGIGLAIAARAARDGARVALMAKTAEPHPKLPGTTAAVQNLLGGDEALARSRTQEIMGDAAQAILVRDPRETTELVLDLFVDSRPEERL
jgi:citronellol/citronellal dehydrogenase